MTTKRRQALGRGLAALLNQPAPIHVHSQKPEYDYVDSKYPHELSSVPLDRIRPNRFQPRQDFDEESLAELADSIKQAGLIQPLLVRQVGDSYEIVAGERRWRAAQRAGLAAVPCVISPVTDEESLLMALIENLQRENLNPMEEAEAYARLREQFGLSQEQVAERVGKSRAAVANSLRLLGLPREIQEDVRDGTITAGHARALLGVMDPARQRKIWQEVKRLGLSVRETEDMARPQPGERSRQTSAFVGRPRTKPDPQADLLAQELMSRLGCRVVLRRRGGHRGRVELYYESLEELERILELLGLPTGARL